MTPMNLNDMVNGEEGHFDFDVLEAAYRFELCTNELEKVYFKIANCRECYDNFYVVMIFDRLNKNPDMPIEVPKRLSHKLLDYIDIKG
jgi:hypothetical protein